MNLPTNQTNFETGYIDLSADVSASFLDAAAPLALHGQSQLGLEQRKVLDVWMTFDNNTRVYTHGESWHCPLHSCDDPCICMLDLQTAVRNFGSEDGGPVSREQPCCGLLMQVN